MKKMQTIFVKWFPNVNVHSLFGLVQDLDLHLLKVGKGNDRNCYNLCILDWY